MTMTTTLDKTSRFVITKALREAAGFSKTEKLQVTSQAGLVLITAARRSKGRVVKKGKGKVFEGELPEVDLAEAVNAARHYTR